MTVFSLTEKIEFPPAFLADFDGLLCVGGDLSSQRILCAYRNGIFPWFSKDEPFLWWSPDPRLVLFPQDIKISKSLRKKIKKNYFKITMDRAFEEVIQACSYTRTMDNQETWLVDEMIEAYICLYKQGYAHSVEAWKAGKLAGGLYGISLGGVFFGESMFSLISDASKTALAALSVYLEKLKFDFIDCQVTTKHLLSMGAVEISRNKFLNMLKSSLKKQDITGKWKFHYNCHGRMTTTNNESLL